MRLIRRLLFLAIVGVGGVAAFNYFSDHQSPLRSSAAARDVQTAKQEAVKVANRAVAKASTAAGEIGDTMSDSALTAKIKSKMALDDHVNARAINVDTSGSVVTLSGTVLSKEQRERALSLARDTAGVKQVIDRLQVRKP